MWNIQQNKHITITVYTKKGKVFWHDSCISKPCVDSDARCKWNKYHPCFARTSNVIVESQCNAWLTPGQNATALYGSDMLAFCTLVQCQSTPSVSHHHSKQVPLELAKFTSIYPEHESSFESVAVFIICPPPPPTPNSASIIIQLAR